ncbi:hypothetical protein NE865_07370 [Phthorimaea operculella]|nr:hypothetical protein NE865_07370 [Phthorimaea operculella]
MESQMCRMLLCVVLVSPVCLSSDVVQDLRLVDHEVYLNSSRSLRFKKSEESSKTCLNVHPNARDIVKRFYAILPYFDKEHAHTVFLHKFRGTVNQMSKGVDMLDREAAYYAAVLTPIVFIQHYRDIWCLVERFHRALRLYQISHPTEKRASLKLLQNLRSVNQKIRSFMMNLPTGSPTTKKPPPLEFDDDGLPDKKDIRYLRELVKSLG